MCSRRRSLPRYRGLEVNSGCLYFPFAAFLLLRLSFVLFCVRVSVRIPLKGVGELASDSSLVFTFTCFGFVPD